MRIPSLSPTSWLALALTFLGLVFVAIAIASDWLDAWAPNLATDAFAIALTIAVVERIVRREARQRLWPRVESAMDGLRQEFRKFVHGLAWDYASTHLHTFRPMPLDPLAFLDHWLAEKEAQDACQIPVQGDERVEISYVVYEGLEMGNALRFYRELDRDVMEPEVVRAIDDYLWHGVQDGRTMYAIAGRSANPGESYAMAERAFVRAGFEFGAVLARHHPRGLIELDDPTRTAMQEHSEHLLKRAGEILASRWRPRPGPG